MVDNTKSKEIAQTILSQIKALDFWALASWGARNYFLVDNGVKFQINTPKVSNGWVEIKLNGKDLYDIKTFNNRNRELGESKDNYCDMLTSAIDSLVENKDYTERIRY